MSHSCLIHVHYMWRRRQNLSFLPAALHIISMNGPCNESKMMYGLLMCFLERNWKELGKIYFNNRKEFFYCQDRIFYNSCSFLSKNTSRFFLLPAALHVMCVNGPCNESKILYVRLHVQFVCIICSVADNKRRWWFCGSCDVLEFRICFTFVSHQPKKDRFSHQEAVLFERKSGTSLSEKHRFSPPRVRRC